MDIFIKNYPAVYLIYGNPKQGKTSVIKTLVDLIQERIYEQSGVDDEDILVITSSPEDYDDLTNNITDNYNIDEINIWLRPTPQYEKILILDDFLHIATESGIIARHLKSVLSTSRHDDKRVNVIISSQLLSMGKFIRSIAAVFVIFKVDDDSEKILKQYYSRSKKQIEELHDILISNKHTFLIMDSQGNHKIAKLSIPTEEPDSKRYEDHHTRNEEDLEILLGAI